MTAGSQQLGAGPLLWPFINRCSKHRHTAFACSLWSVTLVPETTGKTSVLVACVWTFGSWR